MRRIGRNIKRIDAPGTHGWQFHLTRNGKQWTKFFSDKLWGGRKKAFESAERWRDTVMSRMPDKYRHYRKSPQRNSSTGFNGVCKTFTRNRKGEKFPCYSVYYTEDGKGHNKKFHLHHYNSDEEALKAAVKFRLERETKEGVESDNIDIYNDFKGKSAA